MLTKRQEEILNFIVSFKKKNGYSPTMLEISTEFGFNVNAAQDHVGALVKKGVIKKTKGISRSIVVLQEGIKLCASTDKSSSTQL